MTDVEEASEDDLFTFQEESSYHSRATASTTTSKGLRSICSSTLGNLSSLRGATPQRQHGGRPFSLYWALLKKKCLYGREKELKILLDAFDSRLGAQAKPQLLLLRGKSGVGKSTIVEKAFDRPSSTNFIMGKCDQLSRPDPYSPFVQALTQFIERAENKGPEFVQELKNAILGTRRRADLIERYRILSVVVPAVNKILPDDDYSVLSVGTPNIVTCDAPLSEAYHRNRLRLGFRSLFRAISSRERPLVVVADDLQWADRSTLELLESLVRDNSNDGLVIVGTCRPDNQTNSLLSAMIGRLENDESSCLVQVVPIDNLSLKSTHELVADILQQPLLVCEELAQLIQDNTLGNPLFIVRTLQALVDSSILVPDPPSRSWLWDDELWKEFESMIKRDIKSLIKSQIKRLPNTSRLLLRTCACIGAKVDVNLISKILVETYVPEAMQNVVDHGFMRKIPHKHGCYAFSHDVIQLVSYSLIPELEKNTSHLVIGRMLMQNMSPDELDDNLFLVVNQMNRGMAHLRNQFEREDLAALCLKAGVKAALATDHDNAAAHFMLGTTLLNSHSWSRKYKLSLDLYSSLAEAEYEIGGSGMIEFAVREVIEMGRSLDDKMRVYLIQMQSLGREFKFKEAIELGLKILRHHGEKFPNLDNANALASDESKIKRVLTRKKVEEILCLPGVVNTDTRAVMGILSLVTTYALVGWPEVYPFFCSRIVQMSLNNGLCHISAQGFVMYSRFLCSRGDIELGYKYGRLALSMLDRIEVPARQTARVRGIFFGWIAPWKEPLRSTVVPTFDAHRGSLENSDIEYAMFSARAYGINAWMAGTPLPNLEEKLQSLLSLETQDCGPWLDGLVAQLLMVRELMGNPTIAESTLVRKARLKRPPSHIDIRKDEIAESKPVESPFDFTVEVSTWSMIQAFLDQDFNRTLELVEEAQKMSKNAPQPSFVLTSSRTFYHCLAALAITRRALKNKGRHLSVARKAWKQFKLIADKSPQNCINKTSLLEAEFAAINGSIEAAYKLYNISILSSSEKGFLLDEAIACECAFISFHDNGQRRRAQKFLERSKYLYAEYGAQPAVERLAKMQCFI